MSGVDSHAFVVLVGGGAFDGAEGFFGDEGGDEADGAVDTEEGGGAEPAEGGVEQGDDEGGEAGDDGGELVGDGGAGGAGVGVEQFGEPGALGAGEGVLHDGVGDDDGDDDEDGDAGVDEQEQREREDHHDGGAEQVDPAAADPVGGLAPVVGGEDADPGGDAQGGEGEGVVGEFLALEVGQHEGDGDGVAGGFGDAQADAAQDVPPVLFEDLGDGVLDDLAAGLDLFEDGGLGDLAADNEADDDQDDGQQERDAPGPGAGQVDRDEEDQVGQEQADREAGLDDAGVLAFAAPGGVFVGHEDGAAPFGAVGRPWTMRTRTSRMPAQMPTVW